ncbi:hypothetical protein lbkm_1934 [Lachnospiraceae bacterium KM106-2]|nr:hypothetical protein lbkm_1934 [Lachnospiraceae bacterium KM106-2]
MGSYLVMRNNMKRVMKSKVYPIVVILILMLLYGLHLFYCRQDSAVLHIGVLPHNNEQKLTQSDDIQYENLALKDVHVDMLMRRYDYILDVDRVLEKNPMVISSLDGVRQEIKRGNTTDTGDEKQLIGVLMMITMMMAGIYASKIIKDQREGTISRYCQTGKSKFSYRIGYGCSTALLVILPAFLAMLLIRIVEKETSINIVVILVLTLAIGGVATLIGMGLSCLCKSDLSANLLNSSIAVVALLLSGVYFDNGTFPYLLQVGSNLSPIHIILRLYTYLCG